MHVCETACIMFVCISVYVCMHGLMPHHDRLITFRPNFVNKQTGLLSLQDLRQVWRAYPTELHSRLLLILTRFGVRC